MRSPIARPALSVNPPCRRALNQPSSRLVNQPSSRAVIRTLRSLIGAAVIIASACAAPASTGPVASRVDEAPPLMLTTGDLAMIVSVPESTPAAVTVDGPHGFSQRLTTTGVLKGLSPGRYTVAAGSVTSASGVTYVPASTVQTTTIAVGVATVVTVDYTAIAMRANRSR